jgi:cytochrome c biogenesis protein CcdA/thiol-disulfide isomerase/thioredoxin
MVLLLGFALVAGFATCLSPCVLPVLPAVLSGGTTGGRRRPLGIVTGLVVSFTFAVVALVYVISALGLPNDLMRTFAVAILLVFGLSLIVPALSARFEAWLSRFGRVSASPSGEGFGSGLVLGFGLGFLYAPCAGPILAGVITVSAAQSFTAGRLAVALAYALGSALALYLIMLGGRRVTGPIVRRSHRVQQALGVLMIVVAVLVYAQVDVRFQTAVAANLPSFLSGPADSLQERAAASGLLDDLNGPLTHPIGLAEAEQGKPLPNLGQAPELTGTQEWFNTPDGEPLSIRALTRGQGRVVLIDFWTYTCINCIRTFPHLRALNSAYRDDGLTIIGVHSPEFPFEKEAGNVAAAIDQNDLTYPVVQDNELATWDAFHNAFWPADYLIDANGDLRYIHFGEGDYEANEAAIRSLLAEAGEQKLDSNARARTERAAAGVRTPEAYLGAARAQGFVNPFLGQPISPGIHDYQPFRQVLPPNALVYEGPWEVTDEGATALDGARLRLDFTARRVFLVMGSPEGSRSVRVLLDGKPIPDRLAGDDVRRAVASVDQERLYRLVELPRAERHELTLLPEGGISGYAFTFG